MPIRPITTASLSQASDFVDIKVSVFLAGPSINPLKSIDDIDDGEVDARGKKLRHFLFSNIKKEDGFDVVLGEHKQLIAEGEELWEDAANLALTEMAYIKKFDSLIILPSSVGSFCEFGLFSANGSVCRKMLTVLDSKHANPPGYLHLGPAKLAAHQKGIIEILDYEAFDSILEKSINFLKGIRRDMLMNRVLHE